MSRTSSGRFAPGTSGNPKGRPSKTEQRADAAIVRLDGFSNPYSGVGTAMDRRVYSSYAGSVVNDFMALDLRRTNFLAKRIIEAIVEESMRRGWALKVEDKGLAEDLHKYCEDLGVDEKIIEAGQKEREAGGAALFPIIDGAQGDLSEPLDEGAIASIKAIHLIEPRELIPLDWDADLASPTWGRPRLYQFVPASSGLVTVGVSAIHASRLIVFPGARYTRQAQFGQRMGWGDSSLSPAWEVLSDYGLSWGTAATLLSNHGKETLQQDGLDKMMADVDGLARWERHMEAMRMTWSALRMNVIDGQSTISRSTGTLAGVSELLNEFKTLVAAAAETPVAILMGRDGTGLNAGDEDTRAWYARCERYRSKRLRPQHRRLIEMCMLSGDAPTGGKLPKLWSIEYKPLWAPTEKEIADTRKVDADRAVALINAQVVSADDVAESFFGGDTYSPDIVINWERRKKQQELDTTELSPEDEAAMAGGEVDGEEVDDGEATPEEEAALNATRGDSMDDLEDDGDDDELDELIDDDEEDDLEDDDGEVGDDEDEPRDDADDLRLDFNPRQPRNKGKFAKVAGAGAAAKAAHAKRVAAADKKVARAAVKVAAAKAKVSAAKAKVTVAKRDALTALRASRRAKSLAEKAPTKANIAKANAASKKADRAIARYQAAVKRHESHVSAHVAAKGAHADAKAARKEAKASAKTKPAAKDSRAKQKKEEPKKPEEKPAPPSEAAAHSVHEHAQAHAPTKDHESQVDESAQAMRKMASDMAPIHDSAVFDGSTKAALDVHERAMAARAEMQRIHEAGKAIDDPSSGTLWARQTAVFNFDRTERALGDVQHLLPPEKQTLTQLGDFAYKGASNKFAKEVTKEQSEALFRYSESTDRAINGMLRNSGGRIDAAAIPKINSLHGKPGIGEELGRDIGHLDAAIQRHEIKRDVQVYRVVKDDQHGTFSRLAPGDSFLDHGYVSTTGSRAVLDTFASTIKNEHGEISERQQINFHITLKKGQKAAPMNDVTAFQGEKEMLLPRGQKFKITHIVPETSISPREIHMEAVQ